MISILIVALTFVLILISLFLVLVVLMQRANTQGGLGTAFGGGVAESAFGTETGNILTKATIVSSVAFFVLSLSLYLMHMYQETHKEQDTITIPVVDVVTEAPPVVDAQPITLESVGPLAPEAPVAEEPASVNP
jgi:preprotein translocase subunit SecG